jgi:competence ComEA-like helix-hairpin-helix protein
MKKFVISLIVTMLILSPVLYILLDKPDIHTATIEELQEISGIGDSLSQDILTYLNENKTATIDDLTDIDGIGCILVERIKKKWSD